MIVSRGNSVLLCLIEKNMVKESLSKLKNGQAVRFSCDYQTSVGGVRIEMITDLANQIIVIVVFALEWEGSLIVNCYKRKGNVLER